MSIIGEDVQTVYVFDSSSESSSDFSSDDESFEEANVPVVSVNIGPVPVGPERYYGTNYDTVRHHRTEEDDIVSLDDSIEDNDIDYVEIQEPEVRLDNILLIKGCLKALHRHVIASFKPEILHYLALKRPLEILLGNASSLLHEERTALLMLLARNNFFTRNIVYGATKNFLATLLLGTPIVENINDSHEQILHAIRDIYSDIRNDATIVEGITSLGFVYDLQKLLPEVLVPLQICIMDILSIISANYELAANALIQNRIDKTLRNIDRKYNLRLEAFKAPLITLIWALIPNTTKLDIFEMNDKIHEDTFWDNDICTMAVWRRQVSKDVWVPFIPKINYLIEAAYRENFKQFYCNDCDRIMTIDFIRWMVIDESTSKRTAISREERETHRVLNLKKNKGDHHSPFLSSNFVRFAYKLLTRRYPVSLSCKEKYYCLFGLTALFESMNSQQHNLVRHSLRPPRHVWRADQTVKIMKDLLNRQEELYEQMFAMQILSVLARKVWELYEEIFNSYGICVLMSKLALEARENEKSREIGFEDWIKHQAHHFLLFRSEDEFPVHPGSEMKDTRKELEYFKESFFNESLPNIITRRSEAVKYFLNYLTASCPDEEKLNRMRKFLEVFANIPSLPPVQNWEICKGSYRNLVKKVGYFLVDYEQGTYRNFSAIYSTGIICIGALSRRIFEIIAYNTHKKTKKLLRVRPFTTIQFLENFIFSEKSTSSYKGWSDSSNMRFSDNKRIRYGTTLDGNIIPSELTVYEAVCCFGIDGNEEDVFSKQFKFIFSRVEVDISPEKDESPNFDTRTAVLRHYLRNRDPDVECINLSEDVKNALLLTDVLYGISKYWTSAYSWIQHMEDLIEPQAFVNSRLDCIVNSSLIDPFAALVGKVPCWIKYICDNCPFTLTLKTRKFAFNVLRLDRLRALTAVLDKSSIFVEYVNIHANDLKMIVRREAILEDVRKFLCHTNAGVPWDIMFADEIGSGEGVRKELFTLAGRELQKADLGIWASTESTEGGYLYCEAGFFPRFDANVHHDVKDENLLKIFFIVGALLGKALMEGAILDIPLSPLVFKWLLDQECLSTVEDLKYVNPWIQKSLGDMQKLAIQRFLILNNYDLNHREKSDSINNLEIDGHTIESFELDFILPGHEEIDLSGCDRRYQSVTVENAHTYIKRVKRAFLYSGVKTQLYALKNGFDHVINLDKIRMFQPEELLKMICGEERDEYWSLENLKKYVDLEGYSSTSSEIENLLSLLSSASKQTRQQFLEFVTGCSRLPVDGFRGLNPPLTITRVHDNYPTAQTCFNQLKLPRKISRSELKRFLEDVIPEGLNYFGFV